MKNPWAMPNRLGLEKENLQSEADADHPNQGDDQRLDQPETFLLQEQNQENIQRGKAHTPEQRNVK